ncbi:MAG: hypothetical protein Q8K75_10980 [Chlamydiales bacterium]|nr:hypothetical protein [Chlamydiales bacterium]
MKKIFVILSGCLVVLFGSIHADDAAAYAVPSNEELQQLYTNMSDQMDKSQARVDKLVDMDLTKVDLPQWQKELKEAVFIVKVKYILAWAFRDHAALRSPEIRKQLTDLMSQNEITEQQYEKFTKLVQVEQPKIMAIQQQEEKAEAQKLNDAPAK